MFPGKNKRKVILIDPKFQIRYILINLCVALFVGISIYGASFYFAYKMKKIGLESGLAENSIFFKLIDQQSVYLGQIIMVSLILATTIIVVFGLSMSHKIAGPVHNLKTNLIDRIHKNQYRPFNLRKSDFFQDLALLLNQYDEHIIKSKPQTKTDKG